MKQKFMGLQPSFSKGNQNKIVKHILFSMVIYLVLICYTKTNVYEIAFKL